MERARKLNNLVIEKHCFVIVKEKLRRFRRKFGPPEVTVKTCQISIVRG